jgi:hypothetical protein
MIGPLLVEHAHSHWINACSVREFVLRTSIIRQRFLAWQQSAFG